jgi:hypothetical protein
MPVDEFALKLYDGAPLLPFIVRIATFVEKIVGLTDRSVVGEFL